MEAITMVWVSEAMTNDVVFVEVTAPVRAALRAMHDSDIRHVPVLDDGELVGIVSDRDLRAYAPGVALDDDAATADDSLDLPVSVVMNTELQTVTSEDDLLAAVDLMIEHKIGAVPVIDPSTRELVGIVSTIDALRVLRTPV